MSTLGVKAARQANHPWGPEVSRLGSPSACSVACVACVSGLAGSGARGCDASGTAQGVDFVLIGIGWNCWKQFDNNSVTRLVVRCQELTKFPSGKDSACQNSKTWQPSHALNLKHCESLVRQAANVRCVVSDGIEDSSIAATPAALE